MSVPDRIYLIRRSLILVIAERTTHLFGVHRAMFNVLHTYMSCTASLGIVVLHLPLYCNPTYVNPRNKLPTMQGMLIL